MGKKYKSKSVANQKKKMNVTFSKDEPEVFMIEASKDQPSTVKTEEDTKNLELLVKTEEDTKHLEQVAAIAIMPIRLSQQIDGIKAIQKQLVQLHQQQLMMLGECTNLLQELNAIQPRNGMEAKLILDTFNEVKDKLSNIFEHVQLDMFKHESKTLEMSQDMVPN